jgi:uncharacterized membrane protein
MDSGRISLPRAARNPKEVSMFRKTVLGLGAALILTAAIAPTAAFAGGGHGHHGGGHGHHGGHHGGWHGGPGIYVGGGGYGYSDDSCVVKKVKVWNKYEGTFYWKKKVVCY